MSRSRRRGGILGRFLAWVAPGWALKRAQSRVLLDRHYDAAARGRRTDGWGRGRGDANAVPPRTLQMLRDLSRDLVRNDPTAKTGKNRIASHTVGRGGITPMARATEERVRDEANVLWKLWSRSLSADYDARNKFAGLQRLVMRTCVESGGALILRVRANSSDGLPVPLRIRVLEPDHIDHARDNQTTSEGNPIVRGIETDGRGRRVAYWLFDTHPGARNLRSAVSVRVPAEDVIHVYDVDRPGQMSGVPWMDAVISALNDLGDFKDAQRMLMKISSCMVGVVEDLTGSNTAIAEQDLDDPNVEHFEPGQWTYLGPGKSVKFNQPPTPVAGEFVADTLRDVSAAMGLTYSSVSNDFRLSSFSSERAARQEHRNSVSQWQLMLVDHMCDGIWRWVMELAAALEGWGEVPTAEWTAPQLPSVEPDKEAKMFKDDVRSGRKSLSGALREQGILDFDGHVEECAQNKAKVDEHGLVWDSDPDKTTGAGIFQVKPPSEPEP